MKNAELYQTLTERRDNLITKAISRYKAGDYAGANYLKELANEYDQRAGNLEAY